jgi:hypothetical protein
VTGLDGQCPIGLGVLLEGLAVGDRDVPFDRKSLPAPVRDDQNVVEHRGELRLLVEPEPPADLRHEAAHVGPLYALRTQHAWPRMAREATVEIDL